MPATVSPELLALLRPTAFIIAPSAPTVAPGGRSTVQTIPRMESGWMLHIRPVLRISGGGTQDQYRDAEAQLALRVRVNQEELFNDQPSGKFAPVRTFIELPEAFCLARRLERGDVIAIEWQNSSGALTLIPELVLGWTPDRQLADVLPDAGGRFISDRSGRIVGAR